MFPEPSVPNAALLTLYIARAQATLRQIAREARFDDAPTCRKIRVIIWKRPNAVHVIWQNHPSIHGNWTLAQGARNRATQQMNFAQKRVRSLCA